MERVGEG